MTADLRALRRSPLGHLADALAAAGSPAVRLAEVPFLTQVDLRVDPTSPAARRVEAALGGPLPVEPNTFTVAGGRTVLWLGPDEWLVVGPDGVDSEPLMRHALGEDHGAVVDVSAQRTALRLSGPCAREVLQHGCPIDLHPRAFGPGRCAQTLLARAQVVLYQTDEAPTYLILVRASFAEYLAEWLMDAMTEYRNEEEPR